jgi:ABC-type antimicrobial peptide transport system permease subunit
MVFSLPMIQQTSMILMPNDYFVSTINSHIDVAIYSDSVLIVSVSNYSDVLIHACHNSKYVKKSVSTMHSDISNIQHAPAYSHSSAIEQIHMQMNNYHDQTNIIYLESFHEVSYVSGSNNFQHGVSSFYSSVKNSHCINRSRHMPMDERIGQFNSNHQVNYSQCSYATPYVVEKGVTPTCSTPYASCNFHDSTSYASNDYSRINEHSSNVYTPPQAIVAYTYAYMFD